MHSDALNTQQTHSPQHTDDHSARTAVNTQTNPPKP